MWSQGRRVPSPLGDSYLSGAGGEEPKTTSLPRSGVCACRCFWEVADIIRYFFPFPNWGLFWGRGHGGPHRRFLQHPNAAGYVGHGEAAFALHRCSPSSIALLAPPGAPRGILGPVLCQSQSRTIPQPCGHPPSTPRGSLGLVGRAHAGSAGACGHGNAAAANIPRAQVLHGAARHPETLFSLLICGFSLQPTCPKREGDSASPPEGGSQLGTEPMPIQDRAPRRGCRGRLAKLRGLP